MPLNTPSWLKSTRRLLSRYQEGVSSDDRILAMCTDAIRRSKQLLKDTEKQASDRLSKGIERTPE